MAFSPAFPLQHLVHLDAVLALAMLANEGRFDAIPGEPVVAAAEGRIDWLLLALHLGDHHLDGLDHRHADIAVLDCHSIKPAFQGSKAFAKGVITRPRRGPGGSPVLPGPETGSPPGLPGSVLTPAPLSAASAICRMFAAGMLSCSGQGNSAMVRSARRARSSGISPAPSGAGQVLRYRFPDDA
ncbi:hypothetical protein [Pseudomonas aeruginosa]|uniref:hypothetical protein n=1 Tax=Pseudomonas aeruginosa TaxID=287 RepID=UPI0012FDE56C|nr:hypothetical protein [Pseudomonas aeruginosa]